MSDDVFEMKKRKGVWTYDVKKNNLRWVSDDSFHDYQIGINAASGFVFIDEQGSVDFDRIDATLYGRQFSGVTDAARAKGVPTTPRVRRSSFLRDAVDERRDEFRSKLEEYLRRVL